MTEIKALINANREVLETRFKVKTIGIFGSYVRGQQKKRSDIDILVEFSGDMGFIGFMQLEEYLRKLFGVRVDLVTRGALKPYIGKRILEEVVYVPEQEYPAAIKNLVQPCVIKNQIRPGGTMTREYRDYINDIAESIDDAISFVEGMTYPEFQKDRKTINAVVRSLEIIGEASRHIPKSIKDKAPNIPWSEITGMRNRIAHEYFGIDNKVVWDVVNEYLPKLKPEIAELIRQVMERVSES
ncbi:HepT-like ribonuclease domain-containing protein [Candidatus Magnetobacterium casense]|nr:HepT-like ribonuclease domain-containing protein [Candidatus Magnetobacterium casensis]